MESAWNKSAKVDGRFASPNDAVVCDIHGVTKDVTSLEFEKHSMDDVRDSVCCYVMHAAIPSVVWGTAEGDGFAERASDAEHCKQIARFRDIVGNPFRAVVIDPAWLAWHDATVVKLALAAYDKRALPSGELDRKRLAVLADALEEAGCTLPEILEHLRSPGPHVRGCWATDLLLGKS